MARVYSERDQLQRAMERMSRLQAVTGALSKSLTLDQVASVVVTQAYEALGASTGALYVMAESGHELVHVASRGLPEAVITGMGRLAVDTPVPIAAAVRSGAPQWLDSYDALIAAFPHVQGSHTQPDLLQATIALPLALDACTLGALAFSFAAPQRFDEADRESLLALANQCAQALDRARLFAAEREARRAAEAGAERMAQLQRITAGLSEALMAEDVARVVIGQGLGYLGASNGAICAPLAKDTIELIAHGGIPGALFETIRQLPISADLPVCAAFRTGRAVWVGSQDEYVKRFPAAMPMVAHTGIQAIAALPLRGRHGIIGSISFGFPEARTFSVDEREFIQTLAAQAALALERALLYQEERRARKDAEAERQRLAFLARASSLIASSSDYTEILNGLVQLMVPTIADYCIMYDAALEIVAAVHRDPRLQPILDEVSSYWIPGGIIQRARDSQQSLFFEEIPRGYLEPMFPEEQLALVMALEPRSAAAVPLIGRGRSLGVLLLMQSVSERSFAQEDLGFIEEIARRVSLAVASAREHEDMRLEQERYRSLVQATAQMVWITDASGQMIEDSPSWRAFTGQSYEECCGMGWLAAVHVEDRAAVQRARAGAIHTGQSYELELRLRRHDGVYVPCVERAAPVLAASGVVREWIGTATDISVKKQAEEALHEANRRKDEFLALLGHELRNPLSPILTALHIMKLRGNEANERERAIIERQVRHVSRLVDDLLDVSRITRGKIELKKEPLELAVVLGRAIEMASPLFEQRSQRLSVDVAREGLLVEVDPMRFAQVLANLLTNAAKYTGPGGTISVSAERVAGEVVIAVRDTGIGIRPELLPRLFEPFMQGERTMERSQGGLGLGLALVKSLVDLHGGTVSAHSSGPGTGSEFVIRMPALAAHEHAEPATPVAASAAATPGTGARRILLVDDNPDAAESLAVMLRMLGHRVIVAYDGVQALSQAEAHEIDVGILDIGLPVLDGYELARRLRQRSGERPLLLVALTGYGQEEDRARSRAAGFDAHLTKPVDMDALLGLIDTAAVRAG